MFSARPPVAWASSLAAVWDNANPQHAPPVRLPSGGQDPHGGGLPGSGRAHDHVHGPARGQHAAHRRRLIRAEPAARIGRQVRLDRRLRGLAQAPSERHRATRYCSSLRAPRVAYRPTL